MHSYSGCDRANRTAQPRGADVERRYLGDIHVLTVRHHELHCDGTHCFSRVVCEALLIFRAEPDRLKNRQHRRSIVMYLKQAPRRTQVERTLALLIESGILYCTLWVRIIDFL